MLQITIPLGAEEYDEVKEEFISPETITLDLEHNLVSISKWESKWCKAFLTNKNKTQEETIDYIRCMTLTENVDPLVYNYLTQDNVKQINNYIEAPMTATYISEDKKGGGNKETVTSELIYYWMISLNIWPECQYWHLNRLLTLIKVCNVKNAPPKKMSRSELMSRNARLNAARKQQLNTRG